MDKLQQSVRMNKFSPSDNMYIVQKWHDTFILIFQSSQGSFEAVKCLIAVVEGRFTRGPKSYVLSHLKSIRAISAVKSMDFDTYHCTHGPKLKSQL
jgi:hypothetical protein